MGQWRSLGDDWKYEFLWVMIKVGLPFHLEFKSKECMSPKHARSLNRKTMGWNSYNVKALESKFILGLQFEEFTSCHLKLSHMYPLTWCPNMCLAAPVTPWAFIESIFWKRLEAVTSCRCHWKIINRGGGGILNFLGGRWYNACVAKRPRFSKVGSPELIFWLDTGVWYQEQIFAKMCVSGAEI